jgi:hypothetical protein
MVFRISLVSGFLKSSEAPFMVVQLDRLNRAVDDDG